MGSGWESGAKDGEIDGNGAKRGEAERGIVPRESDRSFLDKHSGRTVCRAELLGPVCMAQISGNRETEIGFFYRPFISASYTVQLRLFLASGGGRVQFASGDLSPGIPPVRCPAPVVDRPVRPL